MRRRGERLPPIVPYSNEECTICQVKGVTPISNGSTGKRRKISSFLEVRPHRSSLFAIARRRTMANLRTYEDLPNGQNIRLRWFRMKLLRRSRFFRKAVHISLKNPVHVIMMRCMAVFVVWMYRPLFDFLTFVVCVSRWFESKIYDVIVLWLKFHASFPSWVTKGQRD